MNGIPAAFHAALDTLGATKGRGPRSGLVMLDSSAGTARLRLRTADGWRRTATVTRWLAVVRVGLDAGSVPATRVIWLLDAGSVAWPGGRVPVEVAGTARQGAPGPGAADGMRAADSSENLMLWFHARGGPNAPRRATLRVTTVPPRATFRWLCAAFRRARALWEFTAVGVLGVAGIVDGASARVSQWPLGGRLRLRTDIDTAVWGLSGAYVLDAAGEPLPGGRLTIAAAGRPRELSLDVLRQWL